MLNKYSPSVLLLFPPGWSLNYGAPHIGLPIIKKYLNNANIDCEIKDLNLELSLHYNIEISRKEIFDLNRQFDSEKSYAFYYSIADRLNEIGINFGGEWKIKSGFVHTGCDLSSSRDIRFFSKKKSPFTEYYINTVLPEIENKHYSIIGISVTVPSQLLAAFEISRLIRNNGFKGLLILGGNLITRIGSSLNLHWVFKIIDIIILNQGEEALKLIVESVNQNRSFDNIPNLVWKKGSEIKYNGYAKLKINEFSMPDFAGYPIGKYWGINYLPMIASRGCYYGKCKFCSIPYAWGNNGFIGLDSPMNVFNSIRNEITINNINRFSFVEESMHPKLIQEISKLIVRSNLKIKFEGYLRLEKVWLENNILDLLSKAGLKKVFIGMELISNNNRNGLNKNDNAKFILDYLIQFHRYGIKVHLFTLFGFPGTNEYDAFNTVDFILKNSDYIDTIDVSPFIYSKHTFIESITPLKKPDKDWAVEYDYVSLNSSDSISEKARILANSLESIIIQYKPEWTHPIYRMYSAWQ